MNLEVGTGTYFRLSSFLLQIPAVLQRASLLLRGEGVMSFPGCAEPTGKELLLPERMGLTVLFSGACSQRLITWPEYKAWLLMPFFFFFPPPFSNNSKRFYKLDPFFVGGGIFILRL